MTARDELFEMARSVIDGELGILVNQSDIENPADSLSYAILAAGYHQPRPITTVEELDVLAHEAVVRDADGYVLEHWGKPEERMWATPMNGAWIRTAEIALPSTVLYEPQP
jgi:hypothetical protein